MKCPKCGEEFKNPKIVAGGKKSRRTISTEAQKKMQDARKKNKENKDGNQ